MTLNTNTKCIHLCVEQKYLRLPQPTTVSWQCFTRIHGAIIQLRFSSRVLYQFPPHITNISIQIVTILMAYHISTSYQDTFIISSYIKYRGLIIVINERRLFYPLNSEVRKWDIDYPGNFTKGRTAQVHTILINQPRNPVSICCNERGRF